MVYIFIMLLIVLITLLFYFSERNRFLSKVEDLTANLQKEIEERLNLETRYNKVLNDFKKEEEFNKSKKIDETQLMFTKVNMLDDKLTYFNTTFKAKFDDIIGLLQNQTKNVEKDRNEEIADIKTSSAENQIETPKETQMENVKETNEPTINNEKIEEKSEKQDDIVNQILDNDIKTDNVEENLEKEEHKDIIEEINNQNETVIENKQENSLNNENPQDEIEDEEDEEEEDEEEEEEEEEDSTEDNGDNGTGDTGNINIDTNNNIQDKKDDLDLNYEADEKLKLENINNNVEMNENANKKNSHENFKEVNNTSTDREIETALFEEKNGHKVADFEFQELHSKDDNNTSDNLPKASNTGNEMKEESDFEEDLKLNTDVGEGFDIKDSIEKLKAQLEGDKK